MLLHRTIVAICLFASFPLFSTTLTAQGTPPETVSVFGEGELEVPTEFKRVPPKSRMLDAEFQISGEGDAGDARITMMAASGSLKANVDRWMTQFPGSGKDDVKTETLKVGNWEIQFVDINGTYEETMGGGPFSGGKKVKRPNYTMTAAVIVHPDDKKYFVKMVGPEALIKANREAFVKMIKSVQ